MSLLYDIKKRNPREESDRLLASLNHQIDKPKLMLTSSLTNRNNSLRDSQTSQTLPLELS